MNAAWGGQWDMKEIMISMGKHATTENLNRQGDFTVAFATQATMTAADYVGIVSAKNNPQKMEKVVNILADERYLADDGKPDMEKMGLIVFDPVHHNYAGLGQAVGKAFSDGKKLK